MEKIGIILEKFDLWLWSIPLVCLIMGVGVWLTIRLRGIQFLKLPKAFKMLFQKEEAGSGEVSSFGALCISLSATIGTGNIIGVAIAITVGGPGALVWMIVAALFGMASRYAEGFLSIRFRKKHPTHGVIGGPFAYIEYGMGKKWKWLAVIFAISGIFAAAFGIGTMAQVNGMVDAIDHIFHSQQESVIQIGTKTMALRTVFVGLTITVLAALVIFGGMKRITKVCEWLVPIMAISYLLICIVILINHADVVPRALADMIKSAIHPKACLAGAMGITIQKAIGTGISRGIFSNEAGLGSGPIASATAKSDDPVRQGLIAMTGTCIDTFFVCVMTGLCVIVTGAWHQGLEGINITMYAFQQGLPFSKTLGAILLMICIIIFAFTTIIGWNIYGEKCLLYLTKGNRKALPWYRVIYISAVGIAPYISIKIIWSLADILNAFMAFPNLIALFALSAIVTKETRMYFQKAT